MAKSCANTPILIFLLVEIDSITFGHQWPMSDRRMKTQEIEKTSLMHFSHGTNRYYWEAQSFERSWRII